jgi:hypothetical protein
VNQTWQNGNLRYPRSSSSRGYFSNSMEIGKEGKEEKKGKREENRESRESK